MLIYLYGEDSHRSWKKLNDIIDKFIREVDPSRLNLTVLDGGQLDAAALGQQLSTAPFLARKRMVIVKQAIIGARRKEAVQEVLALLEQKGTAQADDCVAVFWEAGDPAAGKKPSGLHAYLAKQKFATEYRLLGAEEAAGWIVGRAEAAGARIDADAARALAAATGSDLWRAAAELDKLIHYAQGGAVTRAMVHELVRSDFEDSIFNLIDAISSRQKARAIALLRGHLESGEHELGILAMLARQFRILLLVREILDTDPRASKDAVASALSIHPFVAQKSIAQARAYATADLEAIYHRLVSMDYEIKNGVSGELLLDTFIASL